MYIYVRGRCCKRIGGFARVGAACPLVNKVHVAQLFVTLSIRRREKIFPIRWFARNLIFDSISAAPVVVNNYRTRPGLHLAD